MKLKINSNILSQERGKDENIGYSFLKIFGKIIELLNVGLIYHM